MSQIYNMIRTLGNNSPAVIDLPKGWKLEKVVPLMTRTDKEANITGNYVVLYVLVPDMDEPVAAVRRGRPPVEA